MKLTVLTSLVLLAASVLTVGCAPPYRQTFDDAATANHWDSKHELLAFAYADKIFWSKEQKDGQYVFLYSRVPVSKVAAQLAVVLQDFDDIQSPKQMDERKFGEAYNLMKDFQHEEAVEQTIYARVHAADLENQFKQQLGEMPLGPEGTALEGYNIRRIYINKPLAEAFPFKSEQIEGAKKDGTLKLIEQANMMIVSQYDHKDVDPNHVDDPQAFTWKKRDMSIQLTNYKIINADKPMDNKGNYIEGVRVLDGKMESSPCLKIFFPPGGAAAIVLLDPTREGEPGYGVPQIMENLYNINNVEDVIKDGKILDSLFKETKKEARVIPPPQIFKVEISHLDSALDVWQHNPVSGAGYAVPFKYRLGIGDNYNARITFLKPDVDPNDPDAMNKAMSGFMDVSWVAKEYTTISNTNKAGIGQVIEYYRPKKEFASHVKAHIVSTEDNKKIEFQMSDGSTVVGYISPGINKFIEDKPFAVAYTEGEGDNGKRWWLESSTDNGVYDKRKLVSPPKEQTGMYEDTPDVYDATMAGAKGPSAGDVIGK
jgi:hypothetical protein